MYQKFVVNGYIDFVISGVATGNITEEAFNHIIEVMNDCPIPPEGYIYKLKEDLTWDQLPIPAEEQNISDTEALEIITGGTD